MNLTLIAVMVIVQIMVFQYCATLVVRLASGLPKNEGGLAPEVRARIEGLHRRVRRTEAVLGAALLAGALLTALVLPLSLGPRKLILGALSLTSTAGLLWGYLVTYRDLYRIAGELPDPGRRVADLQPRKLATYYSPWREVLPWGLVAATLGATFYFTGRPETTARLSEAKVWVHPVAQIVLNLGLLLLTVIRAQSHTCLALGRKTWTNQEEFLRLEERNRRAEVRASFWSRVGVVVLTGVMQLRVLGVAPWARTAEYAIVVLMLLFFLSHLLRLTRDRRALRGPAGTAEEPVGSKGGLL